MLQKLLQTCKPITMVLAMMMVFQPIVALATMPSGDSSVELKNLKFHVGSEKVVITYDLMGTPKEKYEISLVLRRENDEKFSHIPISVSGDIGSGIVVGTKKKIIWAIHNDSPANQYKETDYYFVVTAKKPSSKIQSGSKILTWLGIGAGAVAAGAVAIIVSGKKSSSSETQATTLPDPPGRP